MVKTNGENNTLWLWLCFQAIYSHKPPSNDTTKIKMNKEDIWSEMHQEWNLDRHKMHDYSYRPYGLDIFFFPNSIKKEIGNCHLLSHSPN